MKLHKIASTIATKFLKIGDIVECVNKDGSGRFGHNIQNNQNYTIQEIEDDTFWEEDKYSYIKLDNVHGGLFANCFKKVES